MSRTGLIMLDPPGAPCIVRSSGPHPLPRRGSDPTSCLLPFRPRHKKPRQISSRISHCDANALMMGGLVCKWAAVGTHTAIVSRLEGFSRVTICSTIKGGRQSPGVHPASGSGLEAA